MRPRPARPSPVSRRSVPFPLVATQVRLAAAPRAAVGGHDDDQRPGSARAAVRPGPTPAGDHPVRADRVEGPDGRRDPVLLRPPDDRRDRRLRVRPRVEILARGIEDELSALAATTRPHRRPRRVGWWADVTEPAGTAQPGGRRGPTPEPRWWADTGGPVHYVDHGGPADGPLLVLVHGLGGSLLNWAAVGPSSPAPAGCSRWTSPVSAAPAAARGRARCMRTSSCCTASSPRSPACLPCWWATPWADSSRCCRPPSTRRRWPQRPSSTRRCRSVRARGRTRWSRRCSLRTQCPRWGAPCWAASAALRSPEATALALLRLCCVDASRVRPRGRRAARRAGPGAARPAGHRRRAAGGGALAVVGAGPPASLRRADAGDPGAGAPSARREGSARPARGRAGRGGAEPGLAVRGRPGRRPRPAARGS